MPPEKHPFPFRFTQPAKDLQGLAQLVTAGVLGVTRTTEHPHRSIAARASPLGRGRGDRTTGLTKLIYQTVRGTTRLAGWGVQKGLNPLSSLLKTASAPGRVTPRREAVVSALNGIWGDTLQDTGNPLAIPMALRVNGRALPLQSERLAAAFDAPSGRLLVLVHGLCMNDLQWTRHGHDHGRELASRLGMSVLYLHYNTGRHIADNGQQFAQTLERLVQQWPVPVEHLSIVGHSMGGLVTRSACHYAGKQQHLWLGKLKTLVFLGTPHLGAPLERGGHGVDTLLQLSPYLAPFARISTARSAGISDLRCGTVLPGPSTAKPQKNATAPTDTGDAAARLPQGVATYLVAAMLSGRPDEPGSRLLGDGLVPLSSALAEHADPLYSLDVPPEHKTILPNANHWDLLDRKEVFQVLLNALRETRPGDVRTGPTWGT